MERGRLNALVEALGEDRLNLKAIIKGMKTEQEFCLKDPSNESRRLSKILAQVSASAKALHSAICRNCTCRCGNSHAVLLQLHSRIPKVEAKTKRRLGADPLVFSLVFKTKNQLREAYVKADLHELPTTISTKDAR